MWSKSKPGVEFQYGGHLGEFNGMSSQSHVLNCRVLPVPLGEFTVTCHIAGCKNSFPIFIIFIFRHLLLFFLFLMKFGLWRAAALISSPIHLLKSQMATAAMLNFEKCQYLQIGWTKCGGHYRASRNRKLIRVTSSGFQPKRICSSYRRLHIYSLRLPTSWDGRFLWSTV